jgi:hypothetical protein
MLTRFGFMLSCGLIAASASAAETLFVQGGESGNEATVTIPRCPACGTSAHSFSANTVQYLELDEGAKVVPIRLTGNVVIRLSSYRGAIEIRGDEIILNLVKVDPSDVAANALQPAHAKAKAKEMKFVAPHTQLLRGDVMFYEVSADGSFRIDAAEVIRELDSTT